MLLSFNALFLSERTAPLMERSAACFSCVKCPIRQALVEDRRVHSPEEYTALLMAILSLAVSDSLHHMNSEHCLHNDQLKRRLKLIR